MNAHIEMKKRLLGLGIELDIPTGHLFYAPSFSAPSMHFDLVFIRHGETYGNCGQSTVDGQINLELVNKGIKNKDQRIFQGDVDLAINQLTEEGKRQAQEAAEKLEVNFLQQGWMPNVILISPLKRAQDTAMPFVHSHQLQDRCVTHAGIKEISFGLWDNRRVCDLDIHDVSHLFYLQQHALVKAPHPNKRAENFCDLLLRAHHVLNELNIIYRHKKIIMFSHSIFGAACAILLGKGQTIENGCYLAFDGKRADGSYYTLPHASPIMLTSINKIKLMTPS